MSLDPIAQGDPHVPAHNAEREAINTLQTQMNTKMSLPGSPGYGSMVRWDGDNWVATSMRLFEGNGSPEGVVSAPVGSRFVDTDAIGGVAEWYKLSGEGNTGWSPLNSGLPWTNVTLGVGYALTPGNPGQVSMVNGIVYFRGAIRRLSGTGITPGSIPLEMAPPVTLSTFVRMSNSWIAFVISSTGVFTTTTAVVTNQDIHLGSISGTPYRKS